MLLLVYIQIKPLSEINFAHRYAAKLRNSIEHLITYEVDQGSDGQQLAIGSDLIKNADRVLISIEAKRNIKIAGLAKLFETLRKYKKPIFIDLCGEHEELEMMLKMLGPTKYHNASFEDFKGFLNAK